MPTILLVDDEERFVKSLHANLSYFNYQCTMALTGTEALRLLNDQNFDLALLDVDLPDMTGCDILNYIKTSHIPTTAIMLTGISTVETAVTAMKLGAYDFLSKPINHELLVKTIDKALQHHRLTRELAASEKRFQVLAEASWEGIVVHENGKLIDANNEFFAMFGFTRNELEEGIFLEKILPPISRQVVTDHIENSFFGSFQLTGVKKDGTEFPIETNSRSINYLNKPTRVCAIRDLSDRVRAEEESLALQNKLAKANKLQALGLMAGAVAHDLNNILTGVVSYPELLLSQLDESDRFYAELKKIQAAGKRAAAVVADLVMLARGGSTPIFVENINEIILNHLNSIEHCQRLAKFPNIVIQTNLQQDLHHVCCSHQHFHKILLNLIGNALESVQEDGLIRISTRNCRFIHPVLANDPAPTDEEYVKISLADNGPGIPEKDLDHIFDPFYTTKKMGKSGTGLGLTIVWNTVQEYKGWIEVKDNGPGAVFEIYLPAAPANAVVSHDAHADRQVHGNGETILLIDDLPEQNETMEKMLIHMGYVPFSAGSGEEGIAFVRSRPVDLVLLDMIMGDGLNGRQTYERILEIHPGQKTIFLSGYSKNEEIVKAKALGVSHFLEKPITRRKLATAIKQVLSHQ